MPRVLLDHDWRPDQGGNARADREIYLKVRYRQLTKKEALWRAELLRREAEKRADVSFATISLPVPTTEDSVE